MSFITKGTHCMGLAGLEQNIGIIIPVPRLTAGVRYKRSTSKYLLTLNLVKSPKTDKEPLGFVGVMSGNPDSDSLWHCKSLHNIKSQIAQYLTFCRYTTGQFPQDKIWHFSKVKPHMT